MPDHTVAAQPTATGHKERAAGEALIPESPDFKLLCRFDNSFFLYQFLGLHFGRDYRHKSSKVVFRTRLPHFVHDLPILHTITMWEATAIYPKSKKSPGRLLRRGCCRFGIRVREV